MLAKGHQQLISLSTHIKGITLRNLLLFTILVITNHRLIHGQQLLKIYSEASLNLNSILEQQTRLSQECRRLESIRLAQLKRLLDFEESNKNWLHLNEGEHLIRLPSICLLLNGPPNGKSEQKDSLRLDMVNWIFESDELTRIYSSNVSHPVRNARDAIGQQDVDDMPTELLSNYIFDTNVAKSEQIQEKKKQEEAPSEEDKLLEQYEKLLEDERYKSALGPISKRVEGYLSPVILIPGLAGSRLQARYDKQTRVNIICQKQSDWHDIWLSLRWFLPVLIDCWLDNTRLVYDPISSFAVEPEGVETRVPNFGSIKSVRHLDMRSPVLTRYFDSIIERYLLMGYQADKNLFAAPYDFRLAPQQLEEDFYPNLKQLIDQAYASNKKQKVTLVCHSMGCTNLLYFLRQQTSAWRQSKLRKIIAISSPWGGSIKALKALLVGEQFGLPLISETKLRKLARTFPSVAYLLPQIEVFQRSSKYQVDTQSGGPVLVQTPKRSYNVLQLEELLNDAQLSLQWAWLQTTTKPLKPLEPLADVSIDCVHSLNVPTPETIIFKNHTNFPDGDYDVTNGDGDGTVNHQSLLVCADWAAKLPGRVKHKIIKNTSHNGILHHKHLLSHITNDVVSARSLDDENEI